MVILSLCGHKYNKPSDKLEDLSLLIAPGSARSPVSAKTTTPMPE